VKGAKVQKIALEDSGSYLGREKGCLVVKNKKEGKEERYPLFENQLGEEPLSVPPIGEYLWSSALHAAIPWAFS